MGLSSNAYRAADKAVAALSKKGDFSQGREAIADAFHYSLWTGTTVRFEPALGLPDLQFVLAHEYEEYEHEFPGEMLSYMHDFFILRAEPAEVAVS